MNETIDREAIARAGAALARGRFIAVLTGAGISAESGIPTFRDALTGLWSKFRPEDLATAEAFLRDPKIEGGERPPRCPVCSSMLRPDVVWFGEMLPEGALEHAMGAASRCDVFLSVGTSGLVEPAASLAFTALEAGATVIEVNPVRTPLTARASIALAGAAGEILPLLVR